MSRRSLYPPASPSHDYLPLLARTTSFFLFCIARAATVAASLRPLRPANVDDCSPAQTSPLLSLLSSTKAPSQPPAVNPPWHTKCLLPRPSALDRARSSTLLRRTGPISDGNPRCRRAHNSRNRSSRRNNNRRCLRRPQRAQSSAQRVQSIPCWTGTAAIHL